MAKQPADLYTVDMLDKPKRGRPRKPDALTPAQRAKRYRDRLKAAKAALYKPMFRGPRGETWSGKGQIPAWVIECNRRRERITYS